MLLLCRLLSTPPPQKRDGPRIKRSCFHTTPGDLGFRAAGSALSFASTNTLPCSAGWTFGRTATGQTRSSACRRTRCCEELSVVARSKPLDSEKPSPKAAARGRYSSSNAWIRTTRLSPIPLEPYQGLAEMTGIEPVTYRLEIDCSTSELHLQELKCPFTFGTHRAIDSVSAPDGTHSPNRRTPCAIFNLF